MIQVRAEKIAGSGLPKTDILVGFSLAIYIFFSFMSVTPFLRDYFGRTSLYLFLGIAYIGMIRDFSALRLLSYNKWYFLFSVLGLLSAFYAWNDMYVFNAAYLLLVNLLLTYAILHYARSSTAIVSIFTFYAYSALILTMYLFISGKINTDGIRLGEELYGNANILGSLMMFALISIFWLILHGNARLRLLNVLTSIVLLYATALTGGRKFLLIPMVFFFLLIMLENTNRNRLRSLLAAGFFLGISYVGILSIRDVTVLHNIIGLRFEGLLNFIAGNPNESDYSTMVRYLMITKGWGYFLANPILGYGLDNYRYLFAMIWQNVYSHNNYIELLVNLGVIGFLLYYVFYAHLIGKLIRIRDDKTGLKFFFLAFMLSLLIFEIGAVTYSLTQVQIFLGLGSAFLHLNDNHLTGELSG